MLAAPPVRRPWRALSPLAAALLFYGCSDASTPTAPPRVAARPHALVAAVVVVTNTDDAGPGSLRQAILDAVPGSIIQFDAAIAGQTIVLSTGELLIDKALTIDGPRPAGVTISGGLSSRAFKVVSTGDVVLRNLSVVNGRDNIGGGLLVEGKSMLDHSLVANNETDSDGGGIYVRTTGEQKTVGKFTTIVQATVAIPFTCVSPPTSWSVPLAPATGKFQPGVATGTVSTLSVPIGYLPANVVASLKLFQVK